MRMRSSVRKKINVERVTRRCVSQKVCHPTKAAALEASELQMEQGRVTPGCHLMPYRCGQCQYWHLGNKRIVPDATRRSHGQERWARVRPPPSRK